MEIRRLIPADAEAFWRLRFEALEREPASFGESLEELRNVSVSSYAERLGSGGDDNFVLGVCNDAVLVGMAGFRRLRNLKERHKGWVWGVYLSLEFRGQGLGRALLTRVLETARALPDLHSIQLKVAAPQKAARHLYASMGFHPIGIEPQALRIDGQYIDEEHMILNI